MALTDYSRKQAFLSHLAVSSSLFIIIGYLIIFHWYPDFYFFMDGGERAIATIFFVDVVLGPGLTLLLFKPAKKSLKFDMTMVLLLQMSALIWGLHNVYSERPATTVYYQGNFTCISQPDAADIALKPIEAGPSGRQRLSFLKRPDTIDELIEFSEEAFAHNSSAVYYYGNKFVPLDEAVIDRLDKYALKLDALANEDATYATTMQTFLSGADSSDQIKLVPLGCRFQRGIAVYDTRELRITDVLDVPTRLSADALDEPLPLNEAAYSR